MGIIKVVEPKPKKHICATPYPKPYGAGTIWECEECGAVFVRNRGNFADFANEQKRRSVLFGNGRYFWLQTKVALADRKSNFLIKLSIYVISATALIAWIVFLISLSKS